MKILNPRSLKEEENGDYSPQLTQEQDQCTQEKQIHTKQMITLAQSHFLFHHQKKVSQLRPC